MFCIRETADHVHRPIIIPCLFPGLVCNSITASSFHFLSPYVSQQPYGCMASGRRVDEMLFLEQDDDCVAGDASIGFTDVGTGVLGTYITPSSIKFFSLLSPLLVVVHLPAMTAVCWYCRMMTAWPVVQALASLMWAQAFQAQIAPNLTLPLSRAGVLASTGVCLRTCPGLQTALGKV